MADTPHVTSVIPIFNEEGILREAVAELIAGLDTLGVDYEIILSENGSTDSTPAIAAHLAQEHSGVRVLTTGEPNYGLAMRRGILEAVGTFVVCDEIDLIDLDFYRRALDLLKHRDADMVVGSKAMKGSTDERPLFRRTATKVINGMLRVAVGFKGTDTHGLKAFNREALLPVVNACVVDKDIFASEFVVRAGRRGIRVVEIPITVTEKRRPAINLVNRVPGVLRSMAQLTWAIRVAGEKD